MKIKSKSFYGARGIVAYVGNLVTPISKFIISSKKAQKENCPISTMLFHCAMTAMVG